MKAHFLRLNPDKTKIIVFGPAKVLQKINIHGGDAIQTIEQFKIGSFDLLFVDADKSSYPEYFKKEIV